MRRVLIKPLKRSTVRSNISRAPRPTRRLVCEPLEDRRLLSVAGADETIQMFHAQDALFAENAGQWASDDVYFGYNKGGTQIYFTDDSLEFGLSQRELKDGFEAGDIDLMMPGEEEEAYDYTSTHFSLSFDGARETVPVGADMAETVFNYHLGEQSDWVDGVATYKTVVYNGLYDGIDLQTFSRHGQMKYEFHVSPGSDYTQIELSYAGIEGLSIDADGSLHIGNELGELVDEDLYIYQVIDGQEVEVAGRFVLLDNDSYAFTVSGRYDANVELIIDPNLVWSTYVGGSGGEEGRGIAVDTTGNVLVTGKTWGSPGWVSGGYDTILNGYTDAFVVKLSPSSDHLWSTYLGGSGSESGRAIALDAVGNALVAGGTTSSDWVSGGYDTSYNDGRGDGLVVKLNPNGGHVWSTYVGGWYGEEGANSIAVDAAGNVLVAGCTESPEWVSGGYDTSFNGGLWDGFVVKISPSGDHLWSTYFGGSGNDFGSGIAVDPSGNALVTGYTYSAGWVSGGFDTIMSGPDDAFVVKLSPSGDHLWSTYLGGSEGENAQGGIAVDAAGNALVTGYTGSSDWVSGGYDTSYNDGSTDGFVVKISPSGGHVWSTYLGGSTGDWGRGIAVDAAGNALVTGSTSSVGWVSGGYDTSYNEGGDAFVAKLSPSGDHVWSTYLGGSNGDHGSAIAVDAAGNALVSGKTSSSDWVSGGWDTSYNEGGDVFVAKLSGTQAILQSDAIVGASDVTFSVTYSDNAAISTATIGANDILVTGPNGYSQYVALISVDDDTDGTPRTATYRVTSPGAEWLKGDNGTYQISMVANQVSDTSGSFVPAGSLGDFAIAIANLLPTAYAGGPYSVDEGDSTTVSASGSNDPDGTIVSYEWDFDNDGQYDDAAGQTVGYYASTAGTFFIAVRVTDDDGGWDVDTAQVTVHSPELLPGDANRDGTVSDADAAILATNWQMQEGATWADGDFNDDGMVTDADAAILATHWQEGVGEAAALAAAAPVPGDANRDGVVDQADAAILAAHWRMAEEASWGDGDFNGDGRVSDADAAILASNWVTTVARSPVEAAARVRLRAALEANSGANSYHHRRARALDAALQEVAQPKAVANERLLGDLALFHEFQRSGGKDRPSKSALSIEVATDLVLAKLGL